MEPTVWFSVPGVAQPQGSARAYTYKRRPEKGGGFGARVESDNKQLAAWRELVGWRAKAAYAGRRQIVGPVRLVAVCILPRPKTVKRSAHTVKPDVDKLARALADALTGVLYVDDAQIAELQVKKVYAGVGESPRVDISITALPEGGLL